MTDSTPMIEIADGEVQPGARVWFVDGKGSLVCFTVAREDWTGDWSRERWLVAEGQGLYSPLRCYRDLAAAETASRQTRSSRRQWAEQELARVELGGES